MFRFTFDNSLSDDIIFFATTSRCSDSSIWGSEHISLKDDISMSAGCSSMWSSVRENCEIVNAGRTPACCATICNNGSEKPTFGAECHLSSLEEEKVFSIAPTEWCPQQNKQVNGRRATVRSFRAPPSSCVCMCIHACLAYLERRRGGERLQVRIDTIEWCLTHDDLSKQHKHKITCLRVKTPVCGWC